MAHEFISQIRNSWQRKGRGGGGRPRIKERLGIRVGVGVVVEKVWARRAEVADGGRQEREDAEGGAGG